jgi:ribosomal protein S18 acetylase RimI-like enzyme
MSEIQIRTAKTEDMEFIVSLVSRLTGGFELPSWRESKQMNAVDAEVLSRVLLTNPPESIILVAEDKNGISLGFIHLNVSTDYYNPEKHGHISDIIVAPNGEGRGVGKALMAAAEEWGRNNGFKYLTLNVFKNNTRARRLYEKLGYGEDTIKYRKEL